MLFHRFSLIHWNLPWSRIVLRSFITNILHVFLVSHVWPVYPYHRYIIMWQSKQSRVHCVCHPVSLHVIELLTSPYDSWVSSWFHNIFHSYSSSQYSRSIPLLSYHRRLGLLSKNFPKDLSTEFVCVLCLYRLSDTSSLPYLPHYGYLYSL
jgi:hypothetical protein